MRVEITETIDISCEGVLLRRSERCDAHARVWVVFPYDASLGGSTQPETPARVVRIEHQNDGGCRIAVRLEPPHRGTPRLSGEERRGSERIPFALPIFVRIAGTPWPEESMTCDISRNGTRFETSHIYAVGDNVLVRIPWGEWAKGAERAGRVVRVEAMEDPGGAALAADPEKGASAVFTSVAVEWTGETGGNTPKMAKAQ
jgi:PilZ domain-containing protein